MTWSWHDPEVQAVGETPDQCSMFVGNFLFGTWRCEEPSTHRVIGACVHEHIIDYYTCASHASPERGLFCNQCTDSAETHECPLTLTVTEFVSTA